MFIRIGRALMIVALLTATGAHWAALQSVAWTTMLAGNLQSSSVSQALEITFDGRHPCPLCQAIAAAKKSEQKADITLPAQKFEYPPMPEKLVLVAPAQFHFLQPGDFFAESLTHPPLTPPPRGFFA